MDYARLFDSHCKQPHAAGTRSVATCCHVMLQTVDGKPQQMPLSSHLCAFVVRGGFFGGHPMNSMRTSGGCSEHSMRSSG